MCSALEHALPDGVVTGRSCVDPQRSDIGDGPWDRFAAWLHRFFQYVSTKRPVVLGLLAHTDTSNAVFQNRNRMLAAGEPLFAAARDANEITGDLTLDQILDLVVAIAKISGSPEYRQPILDATLDGLRTDSSGRP